MGISPCFNSTFQSLSIALAHEQFYMLNGPGLDPHRGVSQPRSGKQFGSCNVAILIVSTMTPFHLLCMFAILDPILFPEKQSTTEN